LGKSIYPTPVIGILGIIEDTSHVMKIAFREEGDAIVLLDGATPVVPVQHADPAQDARREFSSSEYSKVIAGIVAGEPPAIDLAAEKRLQGCLVSLAAGGLVHSAHDISDGGLAVTLVECCFGSAAKLGAEASLDEHDPAEIAAFGERGARAVVSVNATSLARILETARQYGVAAHQIGKVVRDGAFRIQYKGRIVVDSSVETLRDTWTHSLERALKVR